MTNHSKPMYHTNALLEELRCQTETVLNKAIQIWQMMEPAQFSAPPPGGGWSPAQCLSHLNGYGDYYLPLLRRAIEKARQRMKFSNTFTPGWLGNYFTKLMQPAADGTVPQKMKAFKQHVPPAGEESSTVVATFIAQQQALLQLLAAAKDLDIGRRDIPVSIAKVIRLKTGDTFRFLIAHNLRHVAQAERALAHTSLSATASV